MADGLAHFSGEVSSPQAELTSHQELSSCACPASGEVLREHPEEALSVAGTVCAQSQLGLRWAWLSLAQLDSGVTWGNWVRKGGSVGPVSPEASVVFTTPSKVDQKLFKVEQLVSKLLRSKNQRPKNQKPELLSWNEAGCGCAFKPSWVSPLEPQQTKVSAGYWF